MKNTDLINKHEILIVGGGAVGLLLGCLLLLNKVDCCILEKQETISQDTRAIILNAASIEIFKCLNLIDDLDLLFNKSSKFSFFLNSIRISELNFQKNGFYLITQPLLEGILEKEYVKLGGLIKKNRVLIDYKDNENCITLIAKCGNISEYFTSKYVVGCDGHQSIIREFAKIKFQKINNCVSIFAAEGFYTETVNNEVGMFLSDNDVTSLIPLPNGTIRIGGYIPSDSEDQHQILKTKVRLFTSDINKFTPINMSTIKVQEGCCECFYSDRFILAGDAAHAISILGGQGLNYGLQDVFNLSWRLTKIVQNEDSCNPEEILKEYTRERKSLFSDISETANFSSLFNNIREKSLKLQTEIEEKTKKLTHLCFNYTNGLLLGKEDAFQLNTMFPTDIRLNKPLSVTKLNVISDSIFKNNMLDRNVNIASIEDDISLKNKYLVVRPDLIISEIKSITISEGK